MKVRLLGKNAYKNGINSPTLDFTLSNWLKNNPKRSQTDQYLQWWEGWFDGLNENLGNSRANLTSEHALYN